MREYPWHQRKALLKHHRWFRNLLDFHDITRAWVTAGELDLASNPFLSEDLKLLESISDVRLEMLLDDTSTEDLLGRLEHSVWAVQGWTYQMLKDPAQPSLMKILEQTTFIRGKAVAEQRWSRIGKPLRKDLRAIFLTLVDSPMSLSLGEDAFLLKRGLADDVEFEFRACPHAIHFAGEVAGASDLCALHSTWIQGYVLGMNGNAQIEYIPRTHEGMRCTHHWRLTEEK